MNEIAVFLSEKGEISSFTESKCVKIFVKEKEIWQIKKEILSAKQGVLKGIQEVREEYINLVKQMDDCRIVVVNKAFGIPYSVFYAEDFSIWELEGDPLNILDEIIRMEKKEDEREDYSEEIAKKIGEGHYFIDLPKLEISNPEMSSKKAIIPYMKEEEVKKIEIRCCHVPPWLIREKESGGIKLEIKEVKENDFIVTVEKKS